MTTVLNHLDAAVDAVLARVQGPIVLGLPLGIGKPNPFVNRLYARMKADPSRPLTIITALSLEVPTGKSELEQHFLAPLVERVFKDYPDLAYVKDLRGGTLPPHIQVREFFFKTGDYLSNELAQQQYISTNYTFVARDMLGQGLNVIAQAVATQGQGEDWRLSLSSNPDVILELVERFAETGQPLLKVGVVNREMPFMPNGAEVSPDFFDLVVTDPAATHTLFAPPNAKVSTADHAIGLHASSLVKDGGTLQIGIGSLGDAIAQALIVRERHGAEYRRILEGLCPEGLAGRELGRFEQGLYGCSEMFVNGFLQLIEAGLIRREVYGDAVLQALVNEGRIDPAAPGEAALQALREEGRISEPPTAEDLAFLKRFGLLVVGPDGALEPGARLRSGHCMTGGFFLGPGDFYERLRTMPAERKARIDMTRIDFINQLYGHSAEETQLKRVQRRHARFMNTTMKVTLLGAAASDALESGQVVSGVGGQYNFVAMAHALPDARSILMLRATHDTKDGPVSNLVFSYGHTTIPRHLRDIVITEYGVADLRAQPDHEVVQRLIRIADSRFQPELVSAAQAHGKLPRDWQLPEAWTHNTPQALDDRLHPWTVAGLLPGFPFGTDLTADELKMVAALRRLKKATQHPVELVTMALKSLWEGKEAPPAYLERLGLDEAQGFKGLLLKRLFAGNL
ncbi:acetyl-CoA hydrolase/transferase C-terminal domain-containing protein [Inhella crocodyli]|uniref:Acetyl-CoA hydrolase n=1 Tax=Inhella crocodyli TaxID=2499851 RepID=A0A3S2VCW2_9BURK|nr:acetyl-CoA hydrolase/transferase C-terminal domain-containing protein [Inhella crocodyli]RVT83746.1 acetyl-CoA hydrolase [Inhella crocodyli]